MLEQIHLQAFLMFCRVFDLHPCAVAEAYNRQQLTVGVTQSSQSCILICYFSLQVSVNVFLYCLLFCKFREHRSCDKIFFKLLFTELVTTIFYLSLLFLVKVIVLFYSLCSLLAIGQKKKKKDGRTLHRDLLFFFF